MNLWKIIAPCSVASFGIVLASACASPPPPPPGVAACNGQPNMLGAAQSLERARAWLDRAEHNKGGWRDNAIRATDTALHETVRGCQFADSH